MKTLKLQLLAASMFACTAAFAQNGPPSLATSSTSPNPPVQNSTAALNAKGGAGNTSQSDYYDTNRAGYINDSYVLQQGTSQYARVDQAANGLNSSAGANQADLIQGPNGTGNNAFQTQNYTTTGNPPTGTGRKNIAYINQNAVNSTARQEQTGSSNTASVIQYADGGAGTNTAYQRQNGTQNSAGIEQSNGQRDQAIQFQDGSQNYSTINQYAGNLNRAETNQTGTSNAAIVTQH